MKNDEINRFPFIWKINNYFNLQYENSLNVLVVTALKDFANNCDDPEKREDFRLECEKDEEGDGLKMKVKWR